MSNTTKRIVNRYFCAILYKDDENFDKYFKNINELYEEVTYIIHDRDINENGETKKEHIHIIFKVGENARHLKAIAKEIEIPENYLQGCNKKAMLLYFIHKNNPEKTQYNIEEVKGYLKEELKKILNRQKPEEDKYENMLEAIKQREIKNITELIYYGIKNGCLEEIKKMQYLLVKAIDEKNITKILQSKRSN